MSILDLVSGFLSQNNAAAAGQQSPMAQVLASLLNDPTGQQQQQAGNPTSQAAGGLNMSQLAAGAAGAMALVNMFKTSGLGDQVQSWLSTGTNQAVQGADMTKVFGLERITQIAQTLGVDHHQQAGNASSHDAGGLIMSQLASGAAGAMALVNMFKTSGLGDQVQSWLSTGANQAVQGADITKVFGQDRIAQIAQTLGVDHHQASEQLAQALPNFLDKISPNGELPQGAEQLAALAKQFLSSTKTVV